VLPELRHRLQQDSFTERQGRERDRWWEGRKTLPDTSVEVFVSWAVKNAVSARIRLVRGGESQRAFAERLGMKPQQLNRYEVGTVPGREVLQRIARAASVSVDWLLTGKGPRESEAGEPRAERDEGGGREPPVAAAEHTRPPVDHVPSDLQKAVESLRAVPADMSAAILEHLTRQVELLTTLATTIEKLRQEIRGPTKKKRQRAGRETRRQPRRQAAG
jgi:transcriptional regulator with XRE-family HTH domain